MSSTRLVVNFTWKEKWTEVQVYSSPWAVPNYLDGWFKDTEGNDWKIDDRRSGDEVCRYITLWKPKLWRYLPLGWRLPKGCLQHRRILIIMWLDHLSAEASQILSQPFLPCHCSKGKRPKQRWWKGWRSYIGLTTWTSIHQGWPGYSHCNTAYLSVAETNTESPLWHHSLGWLARPLVAGWSYWTASIMEGQEFLIPEIDITLHGFVLPIRKFSSKMIIHGIETCLVHHGGVPQHFFLSRSSSNSKWNITIGLCSWNSLIVPCSSWSSWFDRLVKKTF